MKRIIYCSEKDFQKLPKENIKAAIVYTGKNVDYINENGIPYINGYIIHEPFYDREERTEVVKQVAALADTVTEGDIVVHCQLGQSRSRDLAMALANRYGHTSVNRFFVSDGEERMIEQRVNINSLMSEVVDEMMNGPSLRKKYINIQKAFANPDSTGIDIAPHRPFVASINEVIKKELLGENRARQDVEIVPSLKWIESASPEANIAEIVAYVQEHPDKVVKELVEELGGYLLFIDDERNRSRISNDPGIYVISKTLRSAVIGLRNFDYSKAPLRHVFFDWWLNNDTTADIAFHLGVEHGTVETDGIILSPDFTFSVHSADSEAKAKIKEYIGERAMKEYSFEE